MYVVVVVVVDERCGEGRRAAPTVGPRVGTPSHRPPADPPAATSPDQTRTAARTPIGFGFGCSAGGLCSHPPASGGIRALKRKVELAPGYGCTEGATKRAKLKLKCPAHKRETTCI